MRYDGQGEKGHLEEGVLKLDAHFPHSPSSSASSVRRYGGVEARDDAEIRHGEDETPTPCAMPPCRPRSRQNFEDPVDVARVVAHYDEVVAVMGVCRADGARPGRSP